MYALLFSLLSTLFVTAPTLTEAPPLLYRSTDQGNAWQAYDKGLPEMAVPREVISQNDDLWLLTNDDGVFTMPAGSDEWEARNLGLPAGIYATCIAIDGEELAVGTYRHGIFVSHDGGRSWQPPFINLRNNAVRSLHFAGGVIVAGTDKGFYRSFDGGLGWLGDADWKEIYDLVEHEDRLYAARRDGILVSDDKGNTWQNIYPGVAVNDLMIDGGTVYAILRSDRVMRSTDGGQHWETMPGKNTRAVTTSLPEALWWGKDIQGPGNRSIRAMYETSRGWFVGISAGC